MTTDAQAQSAEHLCQRYSYFSRRRSDFGCLCPNLSLLRIAQKVGTSKRRDEEEISEARKGKKLSKEATIYFLEGRRKYYEDFFRLHGHHPNKGKHPGTEFKKGNTLWVGRHHTEESKSKISAAVKRRYVKRHETGETRAKKSKAHLGQIPWNKGLTRGTSPSLARIGEATRARSGGPQKLRQKLRERNARFWNEFWAKHPEAKATLTQVSRTTKIELMARESISKERSRC